MFQGYHGEHDQHPDILDQGAIASPQTASWNWQLTALASLMFAMSALLLFNVYGELRSNAVRYTSQIWMTWLTTGVGVMALMSAFLLRRRSPAGWCMASVLITSMVVLSAVFLGKFLLALSKSFISVSELPPELLLEMGLLPLSCFMLWLISQKTVRQIFGIPFKWFWICLAIGGIMGAGTGALLIW
jgi:hypothetical protein